MLPAQGTVVCVTKRRTKKKVGVPALRTQAERYLVHAACRRQASVMRQNAAGVLVPVVSFDLSPQTRSRLETLLSEIEKSPTLAFDPPPPNAGYAALCVHLSMDASGLEPVSSEALPSFGSEVDAPFPDVAGTIAVVAGRYVAVGELANARNSLWRLDEERSVEHLLLDELTVLGIAPSWLTVTP